MLSMLSGKKLVAADSYESDWYGGAENSEVKRLGCDGNVVVGVFGRADKLSTRWPDSTRAESGATPT